MFTMVFSAATKCPSLVPGQNQTITELEVFMGESTQVSCDQGYKLDVGVLVQQIRCINESNEPAWDISPANCIREYLSLPHALYALFKMFLFVDLFSNKFLQNKIFQEYHQKVKVMYHATRGKFTKTTPLTGKRMHQLISSKVQGRT